MGIKRQAILSGKVLLSNGTTIFLGKDMDRDNKGVGGDNLDIWSVLIVYILLYHTTYV